MKSRKFVAGDQFPKIMLSTLDGDEVELGKPKDNFDWKMVVVYRGKHCPMCTKYLKQLEVLKEKYYQLGIDIIVVSADTKSKAQAHNSEMQLSFPVAYDLSIEQMNHLGLYISNPRSIKESDCPFAEPGIYVINSAGAVQVTDISNAPFTRPDLEVLVGGLAFIRNPENNYPIRGTFEV